MFSYCLKYTIFVSLVAIILFLSCHPEKHTAINNNRSPNSTRQINAKKRIDQIRKAEINIVVIEKDGDHIKNASVHVRMQRHAFTFGSSVSSFLLMNHTKDGRKYREIVLRLFNKVTLENDLKWRPWEVSKKNPIGSIYNKEQTFNALKWLSRNNIKVRGHRVSSGPVEGNRNLAYPKYKNKPHVIKNQLFDHIKEKLTTVGGLVSEWDVINHPVRYGITLEKLFGKKIYLEITKMAHELNPHAKLYVNEGKILTTGKRIEPYEILIGYLLENNAPIDGIGLMGHFSQKHLTPPEDLLGILDRFARFKLPIQITEFDVRFGEKGLQHKFTKDELQLQANYTHDFMTAMFSHPAVEGIIVWGFWEGKHWYPGAALYRKDWSIKPNGQVWEDLVLNEWWTDTIGKTDKNGLYQTRGFLGQYKIEVRYRGKTKTVPVILNKGGVHLDIVLD